MARRHRDLEWTQQALFHVNQLGQLARTHRRFAPGPHVSVCTSYLNPIGSMGTVTGSRDEFNIVALKFGHQRWGVERVRGFVVNQYAQLAVSAGAPGPDLAIGVKCQGVFVTSGNGSDKRTEGELD